MSGAVGQLGEAAVKHVELEVERRPGLKERGKAVVDGDALALVIRQNPALQSEVVVRVR